MVRCKSADFTRKYSVSKVLTAYTLMLSSANGCTNRDSQFEAPPVLLASDAIGDERLQTDKWLTADDPPFSLLFCCNPPKTG